MKLFISSTLVSIISYFCAFLLRFDFSFFDRIPAQSFVLGLAALVFCRSVTMVLTKIHRIRWRYVSFADAKELAKTHLYAAILFSAVILLSGLPEFPRSIIFMEAIISLILNLAVMGTRRLMHEARLSAGSSIKHSRPCILLGAGNTGNVVLKTLLLEEGRGYHPICILDDNRRLWGLRLQGVLIRGSLDLLPEISMSIPDPVVAVLAIPSLGKAKLSALRKLCDEHTIELRELESIESLTLKSSSSHATVSIEELLTRDVSTRVPDEVSNAYSEKTILVTGGAGSIGSEVVRQLSALSPKKIIIFDISEFFLFEFERELSALGKNCEIELILGDVRHSAHIRRVFEEQRPDYVFHAAALKHVHLCETNIQEAIWTNVVGTLNVLEATQLVDVSQLILLSTDKAVAPTNIMGMTKRLAELLVVHAAGNGLRACCVRFGNVLNSRGSAIPLFRSQILEGGPITITHPEAERYFMSIHEAVRLLLSAGALGKAGEIYVLQMGRRIKILDVAQKLIQAYGRPDIEIQTVGLRPGERLIEELTFSSENLVATSLPGMERVAQNAAEYMVPFDNITKSVRELEANLGVSSPEKLREQLSRCLGVL